MAGKVSWIHSSISHSALKKRVTAPHPLTEVGGQGNRADSRYHGIAQQRKPNSLLEDERQYSPLKVEGGGLEARLKFCAIVHFFGRENLFSLWVLYSNCFEDNNAKCFHCCYSLIILL